MGPVEQLSTSETSLREERLQQDQSRVIDNEHFIRMAFAESTNKGFEALFRLYYQALYSHALRFVYTKEKAEDIVCDAFWKSHTYHVMQGTFRSYLYAAARNFAYIYVRYKLREEKNTTLPEFSEHSPGFPEIFKQAVCQHESILDGRYCHHSLGQYLSDRRRSCLIYKQPG